MQFRYQLEPYSGPKSRHACPACGKRGVFAKYIDTETGMPVDDNTGRCNREVNCGYHVKPERGAEERSTGNGRVRRAWSGERKMRTPALRPSFVPYTYFNPSLTGLEMPNNFLDWLCTLFKRERVEKAFMDYYIGTSKHWPGATVFWQIDKNGNLRTGKIMLYDATTGHRVKQPFNHITWVHKLLDIPDYNLNQCLFGEHLLTDPKKQIAAIVESEKTAVIASIVIPAYTWLAAGSLNNLNAEKCEVLRNCKKVILFPDVCAYDIWKAKSKELGILKVHVSEMLEKRASPEERAAGVDLADYLVFRMLKPT